MSSSCAWWACACRISSRISPRRGSRTQLFFSFQHGWACKMGDAEKIVDAAIRRLKPAERKANGQAAPDANRTVVTVTADTLTPESISWAWKNRFAFGKLAVIAGDPGLGKSTMLIEVAALHSVGGEFPCG